MMRPRHRITTGWKSPWAHSVVSGSLVLVACAIFPACGTPDRTLDGPLAGDSILASATGWADNASLPSHEVLDSTPPGGTPGVDYAPDIIEVGYLREARLPAALAPGKLAGSAPPNIRPNSILRRNPGFADITTAIAARYGLDIRNEAYLGDCNIAAFDVPPGVDAVQILSKLRRELAGVLARAGFTPLARAGFLPNDPDFINSTPSSGPQWNLRQIGCQVAWDYARGDPDLWVGIVDTGVNSAHQELVGQVLDPQEHFSDQQLDLINDDNTVEDTDGHGTAVAGVVVAITDNERTVASVANQCRVLPVKIANSRESATYADMANGCMLAAVLGARVINMSWYGSAENKSLLDAVTWIAEQGVLLAVCAGNEGVDEPRYPGGYDACVSVGATEQYGTRADFSNYGSDVDVAAPGKDLKVLSHVAEGTYRMWWGTSFAAPQVAGGAALLWSHAPALSLQDVRALLETTGPVASGFLAGQDVRRLDLAAALQSAPAVVAPEPEQLIQRQAITLSPGVAGDVSSVELYVNGLLAGVAEAEPWIFDLDLSACGFELLDVEFRAVGSVAQASDFLTLLVDNTAPAYEFAEGFEDEPFQMLSLDARRYAPALHEALKQMDHEHWTSDDVAANGPAVWSLGPDGYESPSAMRLGGDAEGYGPYETDVLMTSAVDLSYLQDASLEYYTKFNSEAGGAAGDLGWVLYTTDYGHTFSPLLPESGPPAYSGYAPDYFADRVDLSSLSGQQAHFVFLFESDGGGSGAEPGEPTGWWLDDVALSGARVGIGGVSTAYEAVPGAISGVDTFSAVPQAPIFADSIDYWLDFSPLGEVDDYDTMASAGTPPFEMQFEVSAMLARPNQSALLRVKPLLQDGTWATPLVVPVYVFNRLGDVNADGRVDAADTSAYGAVLGLSSADPGYVPFFDSDLDGAITEADAGVVGYYYGD